MKEQSINHAVLLYCAEDLKNHLKEAGLDFFDMHPAAKVDDVFFSSLATRVSTAGLYPVIIATGSFGMRGFDYRSSKGITLIIAQSFDTARASIQGLGRVGRFGDPSLRVLVEGTALIDLKAQLIYKSSLMRFAGNHKQSVVKMGPLKRLIVVSAHPKAAVVAAPSRTVPTDPRYFSMFTVTTRSENQDRAKKAGESFADDDDYYYNRYFTCE